MHGLAHGACRAGAIRPPACRAECGLAGQQLPPLPQLPYFSPAVAARRHIGNGGGGKGRGMRRGVGDDQAAPWAAAPSSEGASACPMSASGAITGASAARTACLKAGLCRSRSATAGEAA